MSDPTTRGSTPTTMPAPAPPALDVDMERRRILVVDDNDANRYAVSYWLREAGFEVLEADTGESAFAIATGAEAPSLVVLDVRLPDTTGFDVLRRLREHPSTADVPVVHVTASFTSSEWRAHGLEAGADAYLTHPIEPRELVAIVRSHLRVRAAEERVRAAAAEWTATFDALDEPVLLVDVRERVVRGNRAAALVLHQVHHGSRTLDAAMGRPLAEVAVGPLAPMLAVARRVLADAVSTQSSGVGDDLAIGEEMHLDGRRFSLVGRPVREANGAVRGVVCVLSDVTERAILLEQAEDARLAAEAANRAKSTFLATMSHEIRTPINAILGYADLLDLEIAGELTSQQRDYLRRLHGSSRHLLTLVDDVLDLAKVDAGQLRVRHDVAPIAPVVDAAVALVAPLAEAKGLALRVDVPEDAQFRGDEHRVRQILLNLLTNAVKFTAPGGEVRVQVQAVERPPSALRDLPVSRYGGWTAIAVRDTGIGIAADRLDAVFDPFVQVDEGLTRARGGTGLGLTISRRLARLMDGDLSLESEPDVGSAFTLWLPATEPDRDEYGMADGPGALALLGTRGAEAETPTWASVAGAALVSDAIADDLPALLDALAARYREDPVLAPVAASLPRPLLLDHTHVMLAEIASALGVIADERGHEAGWLRDSSRIRRTIAELHGGQRHRLGWEQVHLLREYALLRIEVERFVEHRLTREGLPSVPVLEVVRRVIDQACEISSLALSGHTSRRPD